VSSLAYTDPDILASVGGSNPASAKASKDADMLPLGIAAYELFRN
jgi:hypothetical protein